MKSGTVMLAIIAAVSVGTFAANQLFLAKPYVPPEFSLSRIKGAELAQSIVNLSEESLTNLEKIGVYDRQGNSSAALVLIAKEVVKNRQTRERAIALSSQLEKMAQTIDMIKPTRARILATEAVSSEVALVSRLVAFNDYLLSLFETLRAKFQKPDASVDDKIVEFTGKINEEVRAINDFNRRFNNSLAEFDKVFK